MLEYEVPHSIRKRDVLNDFRNLGTNFKYVATAPCKTALNAKDRDN